MLLLSNKVSNINSTIFGDKEQNSSFPSPLAIKIGLEIFKYLESLDRGQARLVCRKWKQLIDKVDIIENYNISLKSSSEVRQEATHYLRNSEKLKAEQRFLLIIVRLSKDCIKIKVAAANALMILKKTNFSFIGSDFREIQAPGVRLARTLLDKVNFSGANLEGADFTGCSLEDAILDGAKLKDVQFGQLPYLNHQDDVLAMAVFPDGKHLASVGQNNFYVWNLETFKAKKQTLKTKMNLWSNSKQFFFQFFHNSQFFLRSTSFEEKIEIWRTKPLEMVNELTIDNITLISLLALTQDEKMLIGVAVKNDEEFPIEKTEICLWQIDFNEQNFPQITKVKTKIIRGLAKKASYAPKTSTIAIYIEDCIEFYSLPNLEIKQDWTFLPLKGEEKYEVSDMIFTPQESQLIINIFTKTNVMSAEFKNKFKSKVYSWNMKNKKKGELFFEENRIINLQFLPDNLRIAYFTNDINCDFSFHIRDKDYKLKFCEWLSGPIFQRFISNNQFLFRLHANQISIIPLKAFVGKKEFPLSIRNMYFSQDEQTIKLWSFEDKLFYFADGQAGYLDIENKLYTYQTSNGKNLGHKNLHKPFFETTNYSTLSPDSQYRIRACFHKNSSKNKIIVSQLENGRVLGSYVGSFLGWSLSADNRYLFFIYQNQFKLIEIDFKQQAQLVNIDTIEIKTAVACPHPFEIEKNKYVFSNHIFPITTLALINIETGQISIQEINWKIQQIQRIAKFSTKLASDNFRFLQPNFYFQQSKFYFQKDENTLAIWDKETSVEENIKFENRLEKFVLSKDGSCMVTTENIVNSSQIGGIQTNFCLWNLDQKEKLDQFIAPFHNSIIQLSPQGKFLIVQDIYSFVKLRVWKIKKEKFNFLWKIPIYLNVTGLSLKNTQNLDAKNTLLLTQLKNEKRFQ